MALSLAPVPPFELQGDGDTGGAKWTTWLGRFNIYVAAVGIRDSTRKINLLLHCAGEGVQDIFAAIPNSTDMQDFNEVTEALSQYFAPKKNITFEVFKFRQERQQPGETVDSFHMRLRKLATNCEFHDVDAEIMAQIIQTCVSNTLRRRALADQNLTLTDLLTMARVMELSDLQARGMESRPSGEVSTVNILHTQNRGPNSIGPFRAQTGFAQKVDTASGRTGIRGTCINCGFEYPHTEGKATCPARSVFCNSCGKKGHYSRCCLSTRKKVQSSRKWHREGQQGRPNNKGQINRNVRFLEVQDKAEEPEDHHIFSLEIDKLHDQPSMQVQIAGTKVEMVLDTGASANIVDYRFYISIADKVNLLPAQVCIYAYGGKTPLPLRGSFWATVAWHKSSVMACFHIVDEELLSRDKVRPILGYNTMKYLGLLDQMLMVSNLRSAKWEDEFADLFQGIGKMPNFQVKLHVNSEVSPIAQPHRRIPFHMRPALEKEVQNLLRDDIIELAEGPTPWVSPVVLVPKANDSGEVRLCVDMREVNRAIIRERHIMPTVEDIFLAVNGSRFFSKIDLQKGYHQLELAPESRYLTVFSTHSALYRYKRLTFGLSSAAEVFQNRIRAIISDIPNCLNVSDDILVYGPTTEAHDLTLRAVLIRLREHNLTLNENKCVFNQDKVLFYGHVFSSEGMSVDPSKVEAVKSMSPPNNVDEVRSFLGFVTYCSRFIPQFADITQPLRKLTQKDAPWKWTDEEDTAFKKLKSFLSAETVLEYFAPNKKTVLYVDASPSGLGGILTQEDVKGNLAIVAFASRALTEVESRYSQTEREALAVVYGCEHFNLYLEGSLFVVMTDHQPLLKLLGNPKAKTSLRIERWNMRLQAYRFEIQYKAGRDNPADYLSRHAVNIIMNGCISPTTERYVKFIGNQAVPKALSWEEMQQETSKDITLQHVKECLQKGIWYRDAPEINTKFKSILHKVQHELTVKDGVLMKGHRIVIPETLQERVLQLSHEGHMGLVKTKQLLRSKVWFPQMDQGVEAMIKSCIPCMSVTSDSHPDPLQMTPLPDHPWDTVAVDFFGPFSNGQYLFVFMDEYSRFPVVEVVRSTSAEVVIPVLKRVFSIFGLPRKVKSDNGPPFQGHEIQKFFEEMSIRHRRVTPVWPQSNGMVERFMKPLKKVIQTSFIEGHLWQQDLQIFLLNYRTTPHCTTGRTPAELMFGRKIRSKLPDVLGPISEDRNKLESVDDQKKLKMKVYADTKRCARSNALKIGDKVLVRQKKICKLTPFYSPEIYTVVQVKGTLVTASNNKHRIARNISFFRKISDSLRQQQNLGNGQAVQSHSMETGWLYPVDRCGEAPEQDGDIPGEPVPYALRRNVNPPRRLISEI